MNLDTVIRQANEVFRDRLDGLVRRANDSDYHTVLGKFEHRGQDVFFMLWTESPDEESVQ